MIGLAFDEVLLAAQVGAPWAFQTIYDDLAPTVTGWLRSRGLGSSSDDVASETFLSVYAAIGEFEGTESNFRSWVFTIAHRRAMDHWRTVHRQPQAADTAVDDTDLPTMPSAESAAIDADLSGVHAVLDQLTSDQADVVTLRILAGLDVAQTAEVIDKSEEAVRALQSRAMARLREALARGDTSEGPADASDSDDRAPAAQTDPIVASASQPPHDPR